MLSREDVNGKALIGLTYDELVKHPFSLRGGVAKRIAMAATELRPTGKSPPSLESDVILQLQQKIAQVEKKLLYGRADVWFTRSHSSGSSNSQRSSKFRRKVEVHYNLNKCMITGMTGEGRTLKAAHIWPRSQSRHPELVGYRLTEEDVDSARNGLLLLATIEDAFDCKRLCFFYNFLKMEFQLQILDPDLLEEEYAPGKKFSELQGRALNFNGRKPTEGPFRRLLGHHTKVAIANAHELEWIDETQFEGYKDFSHLFDVAIENDDDIG